MTTSVYSLKPEHLAQLDAKRAVAMFRCLLLAEAWRHHLQPSHVHVSEAITVADGGVDASIDELPPDIQSSIFLSSTTKYQIKTGDAFKPWQLSQLKKELFSKPPAKAERKRAPQTKASRKKKQGTQTPSRDMLAESVRNCFDQGGSYVIVTFGIDIVEKDRINAKNQLKTLLNDCGYNDPNIDVWGIGELRNRFELFPALCLEISGHSMGFLSHRQWLASSEEMKREFQPSAERTKAIEQIQASLRSSESVHIRVCGEPGIGKTRTVLEATADPELSPVVVYWEKAGDFTNSQQFLDFKTGYAKYFAILIVDECDFENAARIWNALKNLSPFVRIVTIYYESENATSPEVVYPNIKPLQPDEVFPILQRYGAPPEVARRYSELCDGSPRVAHIIGENLRRSATLTDPLPTIGDVWTRYISGYDKLSLDKVERRKMFLSFIALFKKCGFAPPVHHEREAVLALIKEFEPNLGLAEFNSAIQEFKRRKILQGDKTLYITPKLFHLWLWSEWWVTHGQGVDVVKLTEKLPPSLFDWFGQMFRYAQGFGDAVSQVNTLLGSEGPFKTGDFIRTDLGASFFLSLAEASPKGALKCLERTVGTWDQSTLKKFTTGRREVIWALDNIVFHREFFERAASILLSLAEAENEFWSNNATGVFTQLFTLAQGQLAPTAASPAERFPVLFEAMDSASKRRREVAVEACKVVLDPMPALRPIRSVPFGSEHIEPWRPENQQELLDAVTAIWRLLEVKAVDLPDEDEREKAQKVLIEQSMNLLGVHQLRDMVFATLERVADSNDHMRKVLTKQVLDVLQIQHTKFDNEVNKRLESLRDKLSGGDFSSTLKRYTGIIDWNDSLGEDKGEKTAKVLKNLAKQVVASPSLLVNELAWATSTAAENAFPFGVELSRTDVKRTFLPILLEAYRSAGEGAFVGLLAGYLKPLRESNIEHWEATLDSMASDDRLAYYVPEITWRTGLTEQAGERVLRLAKGGAIDPRHLRLWNFGTEIRTLSPSLFTQWIDYLLICDMPVCRTIGLELFHRYYYDNETLDQFPAELAKTLLLHRDFLESAELGSIGDYNWAEVAKKIIVQDPGFGVKILEKVLMHWDSYEHYFSPRANHIAFLLFKIVRADPEGAWEVISKLIADLKGIRTSIIMTWFQAYDSMSNPSAFGGFSLVKFETVAKWIDKSKQPRASFIARYLPKTLEPPAGNFTRQFLKRYGTEESVRNELMANFGTEGWSGEASVYYQTKKNRFVEMRKSETEPNLIKFLDEYVEALEAQIEHWQTFEERERD